MGTIKQDISGAAEQIARALRSSNYRANFSPESLWDIDLFFDDHSANGAPKPKGLLAEELGQRLFALGGYVGETIRRTLGGEWQADDADPKGEINIALKLPDGSLIWPVQRVMKRLKNGPEDGIAVYGSALGLAVGARPTPFSASRGQGAGTPVVPVNIPAGTSEYGFQDHPETSRFKKIASCVLLFLGSALLYSLLVLLIASFWDRRVHLPPGLFIIIIALMFLGGKRLWSAWRLVLGCIWLGFCPLGLFNSFYFLRLQNNPGMHAKEYWGLMCQSSTIMARLALLAGLVLIQLHRLKTKAEVGEA